MISKVIRFSIENRGAVLFFTLGLAIFGWWSFQNLPIDAVPDITNIQVQINTRVKGYAPEEVERYVTFPIETAMGGIPGINQIRSITRFGLSQVTVVFQEDTDLYLARQLVSERLQELGKDLPEGVHPDMAPISTGLGEILYYSVEAKTPAKGEARIQQLMQLRALQEWFITPRLLTVPGVTEVNTIGGYEKQFHIQPNIQNMAQWGVHFSDIQEALSRTNRNVGGGYVQQSGEQILIQATGLFNNMDAIWNVPVKTLANLRTITVADIGMVQLGKDLRTGAALVNGNEEVLGTVLMLIGENSRTVAKLSREKLEEIQKDLPEAFQINILYDRSTLVNATLNTVKHNLTTGAALVILILFLLLGNLRAALITAITIPLILLLTFIGMKIFGISGNLMSLGALDFGILVDGVVIVLDNSVSKIQEHSKKLGRKLLPHEIKTTLWEATVQVRKSAGFGELTIVVIFIPILFLTGVEGKMFRPMAATFAIAIMMALALSFTTAPALASYLLPRDAKDREPWLMKALRKLYQISLGWALRFRKAVLFLAVLSVGLGVFLFSTLGGEFIPQLEEGSLTFQFVRPANIDIDRSIELEKLSDELLLEFPEVETVFSRIGTSEIATDPMGVNLSDTYVMLKHQDQWPMVNGKKRNKTQLAQAMRQKLLQEIPAQRFLISQPIQVRFNELLEGVRADVSIKVFGDNLESLISIGDQIADLIRTIPGAGEVELEMQGMVPLLKIEPKNDVINNLGISTQEILETVEVALGGINVGFLFEGFQRFPIMIRLAEEQRSDLSKIQQLPVGMTPDATVPLATVAEVSFNETYDSIMREQASRRVAVLVNPRGRDTESFVKAARQAVEKQITLPAKIYLEWGGNFQNLLNARSRLMLLTPLALALVLFMIYAAFKSMKQTLMILTCIPLALVGGVMGLILNGLPFSISAGIGFIALTGIAVLNGVVLINFYNDLENQGFSGDELVKKGALSRLRPVLMTALVEAFGFLPMMLSQGVGSEIQRPLATVVIGGIISSTLLTLYVLPSLYSLLEERTTATP